MKAAAIEKIQYHMMTFWPKPALKFPDRFLAVLGEVEQTGEEVVRVLHTG